MLRPKQNRATLIAESFVGKLFKILPLVLLPKMRYPEMPSKAHNMVETMQERCVTALKRSKVGFLIES